LRADDPWESDFKGEPCVDELVVASSGQVLRIGFHDRMTVLSGFDAAERRA
jgi:hypothetical protein